MAAASTQSLPVSSPPPPPSPPRNRLTKVLSAGRRRSSDVQSDSGNPGAGSRGSVESLGVAQSPTLNSKRSPSREGSIRSSTGSSVKKLIPGHAKRERKRHRDDELSRITDEDVARGRQPGPDAPLPRPDVLTRSHSSLVTVDSDLESPPPLTSRDSHSGYLTTTSPMIKTTTAEGDEIVNNADTTTEQFPRMVDSAALRSVPTSPKSPAVHDVSRLPSLPNLIDKADTLRPNVDPSRVRGKSPSRRFKDVFSRGNKSPRVSPERRDTEPTSVSVESSPDSSGAGFGQRRLSKNPEARGPSPLRAQTIAVPTSPKPLLPNLETIESPQPQTPPSAILRQPTTTVTPPTPTDPGSRKASPKIPDYDGQGYGEPSPENSQGPGHRRVRSQPGHQKSKLSTSIIPPLTPTIEEMKTPTASQGTPGSRNASAGAGFFSSWVSAAQNAANSISVLTNQNRTRTGTASSDGTKSRPADAPSKEESSAASQLASEELKKELAVDTLGSGDLHLAHLGIDSTPDNRAPSPSRSDYAPSVRDDMNAKMEDIMAKRAVSAAYDKPGRSGEQTPVAEIPDPVANIRPASTFDSVAGTLTPPNGSIYEGEAAGVKRTNSVRSKLHNRRSRGSSVTTAQSTIGAMIGASTATLANPASGPKLSGFAIAPKQRNRGFHQQFRSVPDDDFLIEDYSCALQKEILLAGRLYISEGHICFSSNILGWVTTLIISFEEVVSIEKENTAIVIPNAIAVQTLHARHTFRSLLSREATYDLMIGIWRVSHPDSFQKSVNGQKLAAGVTSQEDVAVNGEPAEADAQASDDESSGSSGDEDGSAPSIGSSGSMAGDEFVEAKSLSRKPSGGKDSALGPGVAAPAAPASGDAVPAVLPVVAAADAAPDFPGPATHAPTECTDQATHYDKVIKDEIINAPLGKMYSLLYGPQSGAFVKKFLIDGVSKAQDLQLEDDKKGLDNDTKVRKYQYIKPLGGSIGPKQTTCITTENLDFFDLEKAVSVTCTTQTPDVPSGSAFSTKTRYCLTWAPGNATRFQMNMTIEWTAKSWLKGPIEKGALDGQQSYGEDLVKTLKAALGRSRATTAGSKVLKNGKKKTKRSKRDKSETPQPAAKREEDWGIFDILRPTLGPIVTPVRPLFSTNVVVTILAFMVVWMWFRSPSTSALSRVDHLQRHSYYSDLWQIEENDLWSWLQDRAGVDGTVIRQTLQQSDHHNADPTQKQKERQKLLKSKDMQARLREEKKSAKEVEEAIRVTQERLESLQRALERQNKAM